MEPEKIKYLEFIQDIITRMNTNSFQIKTWTVTIVAAFLGLFASTKNNYFILLAIIPTLIFWFLDTYYLTQERRFRGLFNEACGVTDNINNLTLFQIRPDLYKGKKYSYFNVFKSVTIATLYFSIILILIILFFIF